jgi:LysM repeat protein
MLKFHQAAFHQAVEIHSPRPSTGYRTKEGKIMSDIVTSTTASGNAVSVNAVSGNAPVSHLRLTRRGRAVLTTLAAAPLVFAALAFALNGGMATATGEEGSTEYVTVLSGQSLWQLAEEVAPEEDPREVVAQLLRANSLESAEIFPGQRLAVPSQYL